jgi:serine/threonine protein kinase
MNKTHKNNSNLGHKLNMKISTKTKKMNGLTYLSKKYKSRLPEMQTYKMNCLQNKLSGRITVKSSFETGIDKDEFVHVIISNLQDYPDDVIVKMHDKRSIFVQKELKALHKIEGFQNSVKLICDFSCLDDKSRWINRVSKNITFCNNKKDELHFFIFEYIKDGQLDEFLLQNPHIEIMGSLFLQVALAIITLNQDYYISHGDLNTGNILVDQTNYPIIKYTVDNKTIDVVSHGIIPRLIDFGRSKIYDKPVELQYVLDDICIIFSAMNMWVKDETVKHAIHECISLETDKIQNYHMFISRIQETFRLRSIS